MQSAIPLACFLSMIRPPGIQFENSLLQIAPVDKANCPFMRDSNDVGFWLYTRHNPTVYQELMVGDDERLFASNIDFHAPTVIYFHAFMENPEDGSGLRIREAYMVRGDTNVIMVDASRLEAGPWYFTAAENTWYIGKFAAQFIDYLVSRGLDLSKTHLVGHSLGAQAAGVAGSALKSGKVSRITGLDPALPLFNGLPLEQRLDKTDAEFVDVIHTDAGIFGVNEPVGHADFYPNGGISPQPGCELEVVIPQALLLNKCDNKTTTDYFTYYLTPNNRTTQFNKDLYKLFTFIQSVRRKSKINKKKLLKKEEKVVKENNFDLKTNGNQAKFKSAIGENSSQSDGNPIKIDMLRDKTGHEQSDQDDQIMVESVKKSYYLQPQNNKNNETTKNNQTTKNKTMKRAKRFINPFRRSEAEESENFLFRILNFLLKNRKSVIPVYSVMREISTLVKSANGELNHVTKERNNFIGTPPVLNPVTYTLELGNEGRTMAFLKKLIGLTPKGDRLTINGSGK